METGGAGASGLVIEEETANELGLHSFGEMYVAGMGGRLLCQFRRGEELTVGPVSIQRPLFMQMSLSGVVNGAPGPVVGILGYASAVFSPTQGYASVIPLFPTHNFC